MVSIKPHRHRTASLVAGSQLWVTDNTKKIGAVSTVFAGDQERRRREQEEQETWAAVAFQAAWRARKARLKYKQHRMRVSNQGIWMGQGGPTRQTLMMEKAEKERRERMEREAAGEGGPQVFSFDTGTFVDDFSSKTSHIGHTIPGYTGHLPARKEHVGTTYGQGGAASFELYKDYMQQPSVVHDEPSIDTQRRRFSQHSAVPTHLRGRREFTPAWRLADEEGEARQRNARHLGGHARAPYGTDRIDEPLGKVHYQSMAQTGPGAFFARETKEQHKSTVEDALAGALDFVRHGQPDERAPTPPQHRQQQRHAGASEGSLASAIAQRRLSRQASSGVVAR